MLAILNSDTRMNMVYQYLKNKMECILLDDFTILRMKFDAMVLPMSGWKEDGCMVIRGVDMKCPVEFFDMLKADGTIICGNMTPKIKELPFRKIDLNSYETFIQANSKLTAEGVLFLLLDHTNQGLLDLDVDLIGYGHSGKAIYDLLKKVGIKVRVIRRTVMEDSNEFISVDEYLGLKPSSIIINTSITNIIDDLMIRKMDENLIINLVRSAAFNEVLLRQRRCRIVHAGPLPAMFSPQSAAHVMQDTLMEILYEE